MNVKMYMYIYIYTYAYRYNLLTCIYIYIFINEYMYIYMHICIYKHVNNASSSIACFFLAFFLTRFSDSANMLTHPPDNLNQPFPRTYLQVIDPRLSTTSVLNPKRVNKTEGLTTNTKQISTDSTPRETKHACLTTHTKHITTEQCQ